jgi:integrase
VDELRGGGRARVNFNSFPSWFAMQALNAGARPHDVAGLTGHAPQGITLRMYQGGSTDQMLRAAVEAVRLLPGLVDG